MSDYQRDARYGDDNEVLALPARKEWRAKSEMTHLPEVRLAALKERLREKVAEWRERAFADRTIISDGQFIAGLADELEALLEG